MNVNNKDSGVSSFLASNHKTIEIINEFLKLKYYLIFFLFVSLLSAFSYKYIIHEKEYLVSTDIHINPNLPKRLSVGDILYFSEYIVESLNLDPNNTLKNTKSKNYLTDEFGELSNRFLNTDSVFDKYISIIKDKENISESVEEFFHNELLDMESNTEQVKIDFIKDKIQRVSFEITKIPNMSVLNRMLVMKFNYNDYLLGKDFVTYHIKRTNEKISKNLKNQEFQLVEDVKDFLEGYMLIKEIELENAIVNRKDELLSIKYQISSEIQIAKNLNIFEPSEFYNDDVPGTYPSLVPELYNMYWKGSEALVQELNSIDNKIKNLENDKSIQFLRNDLVKYSNLYTELENKIQELVEIKDAKPIKLVLWSENDIKYKLNFMSDPKLFVVCILLSFIAWIFLSFFLMTLRNWPDSKTAN
tara:strand:- start:317 stop:1564 length:1248 start_codon:yes stop_codon:yes gene_type:complete